MKPNKCSSEEKDSTSASFSVWPKIKSLFGSSVSPLMVAAILALSSGSVFVMSFGISQMDQDLGTATLAPAHSLHGKVLGDSTSGFYPYPTGTLVNDSGTIYFISGTVKVPFTSWAAFTGLGYSSKNVVEGDLTNYAPSSGYTINTANDVHPWGSWLVYKGTVYYSSQDGLIGVPSSQVFTSNNGDWTYIVRANQYDVAKLNSNPNLPTLTISDPRVTSTPTYQFGGSPAGSNPSPTQTVTPRIGRVINVYNTLYLVAQSGLYGFPDIATFNSWGYNFSQVAMPNSAEQALTQIGVVPAKQTGCNSALDQISGACGTPANVSLNSVGLAMLSPKGGETFIAGQTYIITWKALNLNTVYLVLYKGNNCSVGAAPDIQVCGQAYNAQVTSPTAIAINVPNNGSYSWTVPNFLPSGSDYRIAVIDSNTSSHIAQSPSPFTITNNTGSANTMAPTTPIITGPTSVQAGVSNNYTFVSTDQSNGYNGGLISYNIDWGDGTTSNRMDPLPSGTNYSTSHAWTGTGSVIMTVTAIPALGNYVTASQHVSVTQSSTVYTASPQSLSFSLSVGQTYSANQTIVISSNNPANSDIEEVFNGSWVASGGNQTVGGISQSNPLTLRIFANNPNNLAAGTYTGSIVVTKAGVTMLTIQLTLTVGNPVVTVSPTVVNFSVVQGTASSATAQPVTINWSNFSPIAGIDSNAVLFGGVSSDSLSWLNISNTSQGQGSSILNLPANGTFYVSVNTANLSPGAYNGNILINNISGSVPTVTLSIPVTLVLGNASINILSPKTGDSWVAGQNYTVTWNATGVSTVNIHLFKGDPSQCHFDAAGSLYCNLSVTNSPLVLASNVPNTGSYIVNVAGMGNSGSDWRVVITGPGNKILPGLSSSGYITITF